MSLDLRKHKKRWIFLFFLLVVSTKSLYHTPADPVIKQQVLSRASSLLITYSCHFSHLIICCPYRSKVIGSLHFSALPSQLSESLIIANLLCLLVFAEVLLRFWPMFFFYSAIEAVIYLTLLSDSSAAVSLSGSSSDPALSASLPASYPSELGSSSGYSSESLLILLAFLLPAVLLWLLPILNESWDAFFFWVCFWLLSLVAGWFPSSDLCV